MKEYIEKSEAVERALYTPIMSNGPVEEKDVDAWTDGAADAQDQIAKSIGKIPAADVVSKAAFDQVMWERDVAIQQLREDYGVGLGEKKAADVVEVVRCKECEYFENEECVNPYIWMSDGAHLWPDEDFYCANGERRDTDA